MTLYDFLHLAYSGDEDDILYALSFLDYTGDGNDVLYDTKPSRINSDILPYPENMREKVLTGDEPLSPGHYILFSSNELGSEILFYFSTIKEVPEELLLRVSNIKKEGTCFVFSKTI